ncbi:MAG: MarR family winged helix-turn-helix transcriptional regulator [Pseudonocardia sp.]
MTRWLSADEQRAWRSFLEATQLVLGEVDAQLQRDSGLSHADYEILVRLSEAPQRRLRMSELADAVLFSRSRLSHAAGRLERVGLLRRVPCPSDRRGLLAELTEEGFAELEAAAPGHVECVRALLVDPLPGQDLEALGRVCARVAVAVSQRRSTPD